MKLYGVLFEWAPSFAYKGDRDESYAWYTRWLPTEMYNGGSKQADKD